MAAPPRPSVFGLGLFLWVAAGSRVANPAAVVVALAAALRVIPTSVGVGVSFVFLPALLVARWCWETIRPRRCMRRLYTCMHRRVYRHAHRYVCRHCTDMCYTIESPYRDGSDKCLKQTPCTGDRQQCQCATLNQITRLTLNQIPSLTVNQTYRV